MGIFNRKSKKKEERSDDYRNVLSGLGTLSRDPRQSTEFMPDTLSRQQAIHLWQGDDLAAKIIETWPDEMLRQGFYLKIHDPDLNEKDICEKVESIWDDIELEENLWKGASYERAYGGGANLLGVIDGGELEQPLNSSSAAGIEWITDLEPYDLIPHEDYDDPTAKKFGKTRMYRMVVSARNSGKSVHKFVHESRVASFPGIVVSRHQISLNGHGWGESVLNRVWRVLRDYNLSWAAAGTLIQDFAPAILKIKGLTEIFAQDKTGAFKKRIEALAMAQSSLGVRLLDADEDYSRHQTPINGLYELLDRFVIRVSTAADIPATRLAGISPAGLNATGASDIIMWYDRIKAAQVRKLKPVIERITAIILRSLLGGKEPVKWSIEFNSLTQQTDKEKADTRKIQAETDKMYIEAGVVTPEEIAMSRFGGDGYSMETTIDIERLTNPAFSPDFEDEDTPEEGEGEGEGETESGDRADDHILKVIIPSNPKRRGNLIARLAGYRTRTATKTLHSCAICKRPIMIGQSYYDGGSSRRAHKDCVQ